MSETQTFYGNRWETERLVSIEEAAYRLGVSPWTIRDWIKYGKIESNKLGDDPTSCQTRRLVPNSEVERLMRESRVPARRELQAASVAA